MTRGDWWCRKCFIETGCVCVNHTMWQWQVVVGPQKLFRCSITPMDVTVPASQRRVSALLGGGGGGGGGFFCPPSTTHFKVCVVFGQLKIFVFGLKHDVVDSEDTFTFFSRSSCFPSLFFLC